MCSYIIERTREENRDPVRSETMSRYGPKPRRGCGPYLLIVELRTWIEILRHGPLYCNYTYRGIALFHYNYTLVTIKQIRQDINLVTNCHFDVS